MINAFDFEGGDLLLPRALRAARAIARLKARARRAGAPVVYVNDNFGRWRSDFRSVIEHVLRKPGKAVARLLHPDDDDYFVLKPRHSGFQHTSLSVLLSHLGVRKLVLTGVAAEFCVLFTAHDAYMREFTLVVPRDCVAAEQASSERWALAHMRGVTKADTRASAHVRFSRR
jgi:nicotinamidase-related amidase